MHACSVGSGTCRCGVMPWPGAAYQPGPANGCECRRTVHDRSLCIGHMAATHFKTTFFGSLEHAVGAAKGDHRNYRVHQFSGGHIKAFAGTEDGGCGGRRQQHCIGNRATGRSRRSALNAQLLVVHIQCSQPQAVVPWAASVVVMTRRSRL